MHLIKKKGKGTILKSVIFPLCVIMLTSGCSTISSFLGDGENDPANIEMSSTDLTSDDNMVLKTPVDQTPEEKMQEKDQALIDQGMRLAAAERSLSIMQKENSSLKEELENSSLKEELDGTRTGVAAAAELDRKMVVQAVALPKAKEGYVPRITVPDGGYGLHVGSYANRDSIAPGLLAIERRIPVLTQGRPIKIAQEMVRGRNFHRLIIGQFDLQSDAVAECRQALLLIEFCKVIAFDGENF